MYQSKTIEQAYQAFEKANKKYSEQEVNNLDEALRNLKSYQASRHLIGRWNAEWGHVENVPSQLRRDMLIVDYLVQQKSMKLSQAAALWSDWEDYEYDLINA